MKQLSSLLRHDSLLSISEEGKGVDVFQRALSQQFHIIIFFVCIDKLLFCLQYSDLLLPFDVVLVGCRPFKVF